MLSTHLVIRSESLSSRLVEIRGFQLSTALEHLLSVKVAVSTDASPGDRSGNSFALSSSSLELFNVLVIVPRHRGPSFAKTGTSRATDHQRS
jgi:hypothetical protein